MRSRGTQAWTIAETRKPKTSAHQTSHAMRPASFSASRITALECHAMPARRIVSLALCLLALAPAAAHADGDPASDFLLQQDAYYPYAPKTSPQMRKALDGL